MLGAQTEDRKFAATAAHNGLKSILDQRRAKFQNLIFSALKSIKITKYFRLIGRHLDFDSDMAKGQ